MHSTLVDLPGDVLGMILQHVPCIMRPYLGQVCCQFRDRRCTPSTFEYAIRSHAYVEAWELVGNMLIRITRMGERRHVGLLVEYFRLPTSMDATADTVPLHRLPLRKVGDVMLPQLQQPCCAAFNPSNPLLFAVYDEAHTRVLVCNAGNGCRATLNEIRLDATSSPNMTWANDSLFLIRRTGTHVSLLYRYDVCLLGADVCEVSVHECALRITPRMRIVSLTAHGLLVQLSTYLFTIIQLDTLCAQPAFVLTGTAMYWDRTDMYSIHGQSSEQHICKTKLGGGAHPRQLILNLRAHDVVQSFMRDCCILLNRATGSLVLLDLKCMSKMELPIAAPSLIDTTHGLHAAMDVAGQWPHVIRFFGSFHGTPTNLIYQSGNTLYIWIFINRTPAWCA